MNICHDSQPNGFKPVYLSVSPGAQAGERWAVTVGGWEDPNRINLPGFETCWDAWAFCIANGLDDPMPATEWNRLYQLKPPEVKPEQMKLF